MKRDESTPLGQGPPTPEESERWGDQVRSPTHEVTYGPEELAEALPTDPGITLLVEPTADELIQAALNDESQRRLWLRTIIPLLQLRSHDSDPSGRVQLAYDLMHIAACERASRLLRSDLPAEND